MLWLFLALKVVIGSCFKNQGRSKCRKVKLIPYDVADTCPDLFHLFSITN